MRALSNKRYSVQSVAIYVEKDSRTTTGEWRSEEKKYEQVSDAVGKWRLQ